MKHKLFVKALWWKEYRQTRVLLWLMLLASFFPIVYTHMWKLWWASKSMRDTFVKNVTYVFQDGRAGDNLYNDYGGGLIFIILGSFVLSIWLLGQERRNQVNEHMFALPYPRWILYLTKWMIGIVYIVSTIVITLGLDFVVLASSHVSEYVSIGEIVVRGLHMIFVAVSIYTLTLFLGSFTGTWSMQALMFLLCMTLFDFLRFVIGKFIHIFMIPVSESAQSVLDGGGWDSFFNVGEWIIHEGSGYSYGFISIVSILLLLAGMWLYSRNRTENNGKQFVFPVIEKAYTVLGVICAALYGGYLGYEFFYPGRIGYVCGAGVGAVLCYLIIRTFTHIHTRR
ncbi:acetoin ABC transporter permease [Paenibacillus sp. KS1]|nr:acetoin ABC transporter permease [Paenibacillus sp. KS1]